MLCHGCVYCVQVSDVIKIWTENCKFKFPERFFIFGNPVNCILLNIVAKSSIVGVLILWVLWTSAGLIISVIFLLNYTFNFFFFWTWTYLRLFFSFWLVEVKNWAVVTPVLDSLRVRDCKCRQRINKPIRKIRILILDMCLTGCNTEMQLCDSAVRGVLEGSDWPLWNPK